MTTDHGVRMTWTERWRVIVDLIAQACAEHRFGVAFYRRALKAAEQIRLDGRATEFIYVERSWWGRDRVLRVSIPGPVAT